MANAPILESKMTVSGPGGTAYDVDLVLHFRPLGLPLVGGPL